MIPSLWDETEPFVCQGSEWWEVPHSALLGYRLAILEALPSWHLEHKKYHLDSLQEEPIAHAPLFDFCKLSLHIRAPLCFSLRILT